MAENSMLEQCQALADKKKLLLTVELNSPEEAEELFMWMYGTNKPMKSKLNEIAWNKVAVEKLKVSQLIDGLKEALQLNEHS